MSLSWNGTYSIAEARLTRVAGQRVAGAYGVRFTVDLSVVSWTQQPVPVVLFLPAPVTLVAPSSGAVLLGRAFPEVPHLFNLSEHSAGQRSLTYDLVVPPRSDGTYRAHQVRGQSDLLHSASSRGQTRHCRSQRRHGSRDSDIRGLRLACRARAMRLWDFITLRSAASSLSWGNHAVDPVALGCPGSAVKGALCAGRRRLSIGARSA